MRRLVLTSAGAVDADTGETEPDLHSALLIPPGGVLAGSNLFPVIARLATDLRKDHGWSMRLIEPRKRKPKTNRVSGSFQWWRLTYRHAKRIPDSGKWSGRYRPKSIKWTIINLELWGEVDETEYTKALHSLLRLASERGTTLRPSPGGFGAALLRASPEWEHGRRPAPWFISDKIRDHSPGNFYALRFTHKREATVPIAYYVDQVSSHHTIASTVDLPHPHGLRARPRHGRHIDWRRPWIRDLSKLDRHIGALYVRVECDVIIPSRRHLVPPWALLPGERDLWIFTPELRLIAKDRNIRIRWVWGAYTSTVPDPVLREYALWALDQRAKADHPIVKSALLPAYGMLGAQTHDLESFVVSGRRTPPRAERVKLPLVDYADRTLVHNTRRPSTQNPVARYVIEAETRTRSIELAQQLEAQGIRVTQIYADGLIVNTDAMPLLPAHWRIAGELANVRSPSPNTIIADNFVRLPGIPGGRRRARIEQTSSVS